MDLLEDDASGSNTPEFTVAEISGAVKKTLESTFGRIRVRGEIGRVMRAHSGHLYYDIKDERGVLACNTWKGQVKGLGVMPEEGLEVIVTGKLSSFAPQSKYNMNVDSIEVAGEGALLALLEKRKKALEAEGLFAVERKQPLPYLPEIIGVITSPQGAVIRDILHRLRERFPRKVLVWPVAVQGKASAPQVANAIAGFNALKPGGALPRPDLLIVARGGGSIEDLWGFNEEIVARAAFGSDIPLISAVGHETDTTLIDFVSDKRAPTPTAAAEIAVPVRLELLATVDSYDARLTRSISGLVQQRGQRLRDVARGLRSADMLTAGPAQRLDAVVMRLPGALRAATQAKRLMLERKSAPLRASLLTRQTDRMRARLGELSKRLDRSLVRREERGRDRYIAVAARLNTSGLSAKLEVQNQRLTRTGLGLSRSANRQVQDWRGQVEQLDKLRETLGYRETLARGYAVIRDGDTVVPSLAEAQNAQGLEIEFRDGRLQIGAGDTAPKMPIKSKPKMASKTKPKSSSKEGPKAGPKTGQGSLFD